MVTTQKQARIAETIHLFKHIGELGVRKVASGLTARLGSDVEVVNLNAGMLRVSTLAAETSDPDNAAVGVYAAVDGPASGHVAFLLPYQQALTLVDVVMGQPAGTRKRFDELSTAALQEVARIIISSQLTALSEAANTRFVTGSMKMAVDMAYSIVSSILASAGDTDDEAMVVATQFRQSSWSLSALLLFLPHEGSVDKLLQLSRWEPLPSSQ